MTATKCTSAAAPLKVGLMVPANNTTMEVELAAWLPAGSTVTTVKIPRGAVTVSARPHAEIYGLSSSGLDRNEFAQSNGTFAPQPARPLGPGA